MRDFQDRLAAFRAFIPLKGQETVVNSVHNPLDPNRAYLRYNTATNRIETSKAVEIPLRVAESFYKWIGEIVKAGGCNDCKKDIMGYSVTLVNEAEMIIGCHTIAISEADMIARQLGW